MPSRLWSAHPFPRAVLAPRSLVASFRKARKRTGQRRLLQLVGCWYVALLLIMLPGVHGAPSDALLQALGRREDLVAGRNSMRVVNGSMVFGDGGVCSAEPCWLGKGPKPSVDLRSDMAVGVARCAIMNLVHIISHSPYPRLSPFPFHHRPSSTAVSSVGVVSCGVHPSHSPCDPTITALWLTRGVVVHLRSWRSDRREGVVVALTIVPL